MARIWGIVKPGRASIRLSVTDAASDGRGGTVVFAKVGESDSPAKGGGTQEVFGMVVGQMEELCSADRSDPVGKPPGVVTAEHFIPTKEDGCEKQAGLGGRRRKGSTTG